MFFIFRNPFITYETPAGATGGAGAVPAPGVQPTPTPQPPSQGQGQGDGFRSTFFPNVPDDQWGLIEPHIKGVNQHVTQLQQRYAPFNSYTPEAVQGLARFAQAFDQDPVGQWITLARALQQQGRLDPDLDVDHLESLLNGQQAPQPPQGFNPEDPRDALILQMRQQLEETNKWREDETKGKQERTENAALKRTVGWMREQLKAGGIDENLLTDKRLIAQFIGHGGNAQAAVNDAMEYRTAILGGIVPDPAEAKSGKKLSMPNGVPKVPAEKKSSGKPGRRGMFKDVSAGAQQYMERANQS